MVRSSGEEVVSTFTCHLPEVRVKCAAVANNMTCGVNNLYSTYQYKELNPNALKWIERSPRNYIYHVT